MNSSPFFQFPHHSFPGIVEKKFFFSWVIFPRCLFFCHDFEQSQTKAELKPLLQSTLNKFRCQKLLRKISDRFNIRQKTKTRQTFRNHNFCDAYRESEWSLKFFFSPGHAYKWQYHCRFCERAKKTRKVFIRLLSVRKKLMIIWKRVTAI